MLSSPLLSSCNHALRFSTRVHAHLYTPSCFSGRTSCFLYGRGETLVFPRAPPIQEVFGNQTTSGPHPLYLRTTMQRATQAKAGVMNGEYRGLTAGIISKFIISFAFEPSLSEVSQGIDTRGYMYMYIIDGQRHCTF